MTLIATEGPSPLSAVVGNYEVPIGTVTAFSILPKTRALRLWCIGGAMGKGGQVSFDFHLETDERVKTFAAELLKKTSAFVLSVERAKLSFRSSKKATCFKATCFRAKFSFYNKDDAQIFDRYIAPAYFEGGRISLHGKTVKIFLKEERPGPLLQRAMKTFASLNSHTNGTLNRALGETPFFPPETRSTGCVIEIPPPPIHELHYAILPDQVWKRVQTGQSMPHEELLPNPIDTEGFLHAFYQKRDDLLAIRWLLPHCAPPLEPLYRFICDVIGMGGPRDEIAKEYFVNLLDAMSRELDASGFFQNSIGKLSFSPPPQGDSSSESAGDRREEELCVGSLRG